MQEQYEYVEVSATNEHVDNELAQSEDQQGMARVVAALHAHTWPGLIRRDPPQLSRPLANSNNRQGNASDRSGDAASEEPVLAVRDDEGLDAVDEKAVDRTDQLFAEMSGMRERLQDLPDAERRSAAAEFALRLLSVLETDDSHEDSSDSE